MIPIDRMEAEDFDFDDFLSAEALFLLSVSVASTTLMYETLLGALMLKIPLFELFSVLSIRLSRTLV